jgi:hypothetical protein
MARASVLRRAGLLIAPVAIVASACSMTVGFDGFSGGPDSGTPRVDGAFEPIDDGAVAPAERDSESPLAETAVDAPSADAGADADAEAAVADPNLPPTFVADGGTTWCNSQSGTTMCEDFDRKDLGAPWIREGLYVKLTSFRARSAPNDLLINVPSTTSSGTFVSKITRSFAQTSRDLSLSFAFHPEKLTEGNSFLIIGAVEFLKAADAKYSLRLVYLNGQVRLEESNLVPPPNNRDTYHPFFNVPVGTWSKIRLDLDLSATTPKAQITLDDVPVGPEVPLTPTTGIDHTPTLILGAVFGGMPHTGWTLRYDDVTMTLR